MSKEEIVIRYYVLCNNLKNIIRTGWKNWNIDRDRIESVAEHVYGTQQLAIGMASVFNYDIDLAKVLFMIAIHESEEIFIGDITQFEISKEEKRKLGRDAVKKLFSSLLDGKMYEDIVKEFEERKTKETLFAYQCDKLECDLQAKLYEEEGCMRYTSDGKIDMSYQKENVSLNNPMVQDLLNSGLNWGEMWLEFGLRVYNYDDNFKKVSVYAKNNNISKLGK